MFAVNSSVDIHVLQAQIKNKSTWWEVIEALVRMPIHQDLDDEAIAGEVKKYINSEKIGDSKENQQVRPALRIAICVLPLNCIVESCTSCPNYSRNLLLLRGEYPPIPSVAVRQLCTVLGQDSSTILIVPSCHSLGI